MKREIIHASHLEILNLTDNTIQPGQNSGISTGSNKPKTAAK